jgi:uncharacterized protein
MVEPLYLAKATCTQCEMPYQTSRIRPSFKKSTGRDSDFCLHFPEETNPEYYIVRVCPFCGFASTENFSEHMTTKQKQEFMEKIGSQWTMKDYCGKRTWEEALQCFKLALLCAQLKQESERVVSGILHHIAWLYRYKKNKEMEQRFLEYALQSYIRVYEREGTDANNARLMYLIGELNRRIGNFNEAVRWFARVVNDKKIVDSGMIRASREQWMAVREEMAAMKQEMPEDGQLRA